MPKQTNILLIRHAEKPKRGNGLAVAGQARAQAYIIYFQNYAIKSTAVKLNYLFAAANSTQSHRPRLTIAPLAKALRLTINHKHPDKLYQQVATDILSNAKYDSANILICWHHEQILKLAEALGAPADRLPPTWPNEVYGWLLQLRFDGNGKLTVAPARNQQLMYDDYGKQPMLPLKTA